jgi:hypothetical protein
MQRNTTPTPTALYFRDFCVRVSGFSVALRAGHDFGWRSGTDVNAIPNNPSVPGAVSLLCRPWAWVFPCDRRQVLWLSILRVS